MSSEQRINIKDVVNDEFYQLPKVFFWKQEYRENMSAGAKLLYMLVKDRFSLSIYTVQQQKELGVESPTYVDDEGFIYCILDNQEIEFTLNVSNKTVQNYVKELIGMDLIITVPEDGGANRIYLKKLDTSGVTLARFNGEKEYFKHVRARKRKKLEPKKTLEECIANAEGKQANNKAKNKSVDKSVDKPVDNPQPENNGGEEESGGNDILPKLPPAETTNLDNEETTNLGEEETTDLGCENLPGQVGQKLPTNKNYSSDLDSSEPDFKEIDTNDIDTSITQSSSSKIEENPSIVSSDDTTTPEEEGITGNTLITVDNNYALLEHMELVKEICLNTKDFNVVKKALSDNKIKSFPVLVVTKAIGTHARNVRKAEKENDPIRYEPAYFANGLVDAVRYYEKRQQAIKRNETNRRRQEQYRASANKAVIYNWLEN